jgi:hypothetical protein
MAKVTPKSSKKEAKPTKAHPKASSAKKVQKPAPKKGPEKKAEKPHGKSLAKAHPKIGSHKVTPKKEEKKPVVAKALVKPAVIKQVETKKVEAKKIETKKVEAKKVAPTKAVAAGDLKEAKKAKIEKLSGAVEATTAKTPKGATKKKPAVTKKEEFELEDDLVGEGDDFVTDELSEYQAELESAEEEVEEKEVPIEEAPVAVAPIVTKEKGDDIVLTDAEGRRYCRVKECDQVATVDGYCRFHYLLLWKKIQVRKKILTDGKLERYVEELTSRYPDKFLEVIRRDLRTEKDFVSAIQEMEIDESGSDNDFEDESSNFIDEVRGAAPESIAEDDEY